MIEKCDKCGCNVHTTYECEYCGKETRWLLVALFHRVFKCWRW